MGFQVPGFLLIIGFVFNSFHEGGAATYPCLNLTGTYSDDSDPPLCLFIRLQNDYCTVDGSSECESSNTEEASFGCQHYLSAPFISYGPDGDAFDIYPETSNITLICNTDVENVTSYIWTNASSGDELVGENNKTLFVKDDPGSASFLATFFRCQYVLDQRTSLSSLAYRTVVIQVGFIWNITPYPVLNGVPNEETVVDGMLLELMCSNYPMDTYSLEWYFNDELFATTVNSNVFNDFEVNATTVNGTLRCTFSFDTLTLRVQDSDNVTIPQITGLLPNLSISLDKAHVNSGDSVEMSCVFSDSTFTERALSALPVTVVWSVNGTALPGYTTLQIEVNPIDQATHHGEWSCSVQLDMGTPKESPNVSLYVDGPLDFSMSTVPGLPIMGGSLFILCQYTYLYEDESSSKEFEWTLNGTVLYDFSDDFLYIFPVAENVTGDYTCTVTVGNGRKATSSISVPYPVSFQEAPAPSLRVWGMEDSERLTFGSHQLECVYDTSVASFGINITFFKDGELISPDGPEMFDNSMENATCVDAVPLDGTFNIYLDNDVFNHTYTCRLEFGDLVSDQSDVLTVSFLVFDSVKGVDEYNDEVTSIYRFANSQLYLECRATLLPGISNQINYTWYDDNGDEYGNTDVLNSTVTDGTAIYTCEAQVGSYSPTVSVTVFGLENVAPNLSIVDEPEDGVLTYNETYELFCNAGFIANIPRVQYEFSVDGDVMQSGNSSRYTIISDLNNRNYSCRAVEVQTTPFSDLVVASFRTIDQVEIQTSDGNKASSVLKPAVNSTVTLICNLTLSRDVPEDVNATYNWYDLHLVSHGNSSELEVLVTSEFMTTFRCWAKVGDYTAISTNNVRVQSSASLCSQSLLALIFAVVCHMARMY